MPQHPTIYLDVCCLSRLTDNDELQDRIWVEKEAIRIIMDLAIQDLLEIIDSEAIRIEVGRNPNIQKRRVTFDYLNGLQRVVMLDMNIRERAEEIHQLGFTLFDATHLASAEAGGCDMLLTVDDRLARLAHSQSQKLRVRVLNPLEAITELVR